MSRTRALSPHARTVLAVLLDAGGQWSHGYELARLADVKSGTLYPLMIRLKAQGYLDAEWQQPVERGRPPRHAYRLTATGVQLARANPPCESPTSRATPGGNHMSGLRRSLADLACRALQATLPSSLQSWGWAVRCETAGIPDDTKALLFALDSLCGLIPRAVASRLLQPFASLIGAGAPFSGGSITMNIFDATMRRPRTLGIACAVGAVILGLAYMAVAGAPTRYLGINASALAIGLTMLALLGRTVAARQQWTSGAIIMMAGALLATAFLGSAVDGAARWVNFGGLAIQPSLILLPVMLVAFSRTRSVLATTGIIVAVAAMALQPDRAMARVLALCLAALAITRRDRHAVVALAAGVTGFAATLVRADTLPAAPYVDQILYSSFDVHAGAGLAVLGGSALLLVPAFVAWSRDAGNRATYAAFGAVWFAAILAAALGNYPTPIVGYGGSAIIGYALSLLALPKRVGFHAGVAPETRGETDRTLTERHLLVSLA